MLPRVADILIYTNSVTIYTLLLVYQLFIPTISDIIIPSSH